jgi:hypothetical protein
MAALLILIATILWINTGITLDIAVSKIMQVPPCKKTLYMAALGGPLLLLVIWTIPND